MSHNTLENYYEVVYDLVQRQRFGSLSDIESLIPFERDLYIGMIKNDKEREAELKRQQAAIQEAMSRKGY